VLGVGADVPEAAERLFRLTEAEASRLCSLFFELGHRLPLTAERDRLAERAAELSSRLAQLEEHDGRQLQQLKEDRDRLRRELEAEIASLSGAAEAHREERVRVTGELAGLAGELGRARAELAADRETLRQGEAELDGIRSSAVFRIARLYWGAKERALPRGTRVRHAFDRLAGWAKGQPRRS